MEKELVYAIIMFVAVLSVVIAIIVALKQGSVQPLISKVSSLSTLVS